MKADQNTSMNDTLTTNGKERGEKMTLQRNPLEAWLSHHFWHPKDIGGCFGAKRPMQPFSDRAGSGHLLWLLLSRHLHFFAPLFVVGTANTVLLFLWCHDLVVSRLSLLCRVMPYLPLRPFSVPPPASQTASPFSSRASVVRLFPAPIRASAHVTSVEG